MLTVEHLLDLDIKHETSIQTPTIMRGDTAVLRFRVHDNNSNEILKKFDAAELTLAMPSGITITENCIKENLDGIDIARFEFKKIHSIEVGIYQMYLTLIQGEDRVSVPPFAINVDDNVSKDDYEFMDIIGGLEDQLTELQNMINNGVSLDSINVADGVAGLDAMKKIPPALLLDYFNDHIATSMYKDGAHGFKLDENGKPWVLVDGIWKEAKYSETPMGAGSPIPVPTIIVRNGYAIVTFKETVNLSLRKWTHGIQNKSWFSTNGNVASTNTFAVNQVGDHTFYYKLADGRDNTVVFNVSQNDLETGVTKPIEEFNDGDIVKFGDMEWIVLSSKLGYLLSRFSVADRQFDISTGNKKFDPLDENNIGYYLNNTFIDRFSASDLSKIKTSTWMTGNDIQEDSSTVSTQIGLMSLSETNQYIDILNQYPTWNDSAMDTKGFLTLTEDSSDNSQIWRMESDGGSWFSSITSKSVPVLIRPSLYLASGTLVEPITKDEDIPLSQLKDGDLVKFSDMRWRILDKTEGLIIYDDIPIYRDMETVWDGFLNNIFYLSLSGQAKSFIQSRDWDLSRLNETPMSNKITAYVGLLSKTMFDKYKNTTLQHLKNTQMIWTSTLGQFPDMYIGIQTSDSYFGNYVSLSEQFDYLVLPVVKVSQMATFGMLTEKNKALSEIEKGTEVWLGNYPWIKGNNNDLILNYNYKWDIEPKKVSFSDSDSSDYFASAVDTASTRNAGIDINSKFVLNRLFTRVSSTLTDKEFNIGYADNPTAKKGFFKAGMINTNTWITDYQNNLLNLDIHEDFWLLNPLDANNAYYVSARDGSARTTSSDTDLKITKPVLRLDENYQVQTYSQSNIYAYIPDPVVRGQLNLNLGKGNANNPDTSQITLEEMQSIVFFDSLNLIEASDLTGLELLTNCTFIRMRHNPSISFNITDFTPVIKLGKNATLKTLNIYGVPQDDVSLNIYNQLKGKFPNITEGGVYTNAYNDILISLAELQGVPEKVLIDFSNMYTSSSYIDEDILTQFHRVSVRSNGKGKLTQVKPFNSSSYIDLSDPVSSLDISESSFDPNWVRVPTNYTSSETALYTLGFKTSDGKENILSFKVDANYGYIWEENEKRPILLLTKIAGDSQTVVTLPSTVNGLTIKQLGGKFDSPFGSQNSITSLTVPVSYDTIAGAFRSTNSLQHVYVYNDNIEYKEFTKRESFGGKTNISSITVFHGRQNSTTYDFYNYKKTAEWNEFKDKYEFQLL